VRACVTARSGSDWRWARVSDGRGEEAMALAVVVMVTSVKMMAVMMVIVCMMRDTRVQGLAWAEWIVTGAADGN
jgi:hypothetical protein